ncbi:endolytic transglycosylase MltG [Glycocaulis sp.]|uniref:endolytic transglycosylase MltG n=1 Tax=Glycocaulis sp. TaxID=1969725 RepID=UPI003F72B779
MSTDSTPPGKQVSKGLGALRLFIIGLFLLGALALMAGAAIVGGYAWLGYQFRAEGPLEADTTILLERGSSVRAIAARLEADGLITDQRIFLAQLRIDDELGRERAPMRAGEFAIPARASMAEIYDVLAYGEVIQHPVRVPEGLTTAMVVRIVEASDVLTGEIERVPPEGSLLPDTYLVDRGTSRQAVLDRMAAAQTRLLDQLWDSRDPNLPFSTREEAINLASIVEKETGIAHERPMVAAVFVNRLRRGMRLQSDPTIIYGITGGEPLGRGIRRSELDDTTNPYHTYHIDGLPPTPIANPGREAIAAVLNPPESEYVYFVADGTGGHAFARTLAEHNRNVARWRQIERERARSGGR